MFKFQNAPIAVGRDAVLGVPNPKEDQGHRGRCPYHVQGLWVLLCTLLLARVASAQSYSIDWYKVSGGGGSSTGGTYQVSGTIGQHDAGGPMSGGAYSVTGGFWALIAPLQTPGAPTLYISQGTNSVTVYWQAVPSWSLQQNNSLTTPAGWSASTGVTSSGGTNYLTLIRPTGQLFFRLHNP